LQRTNCSISNRPFQNGNRIPLSFSFSKREATKR